MQKETYVGQPPEDPCEPWYGALIPIVVILIGGAALFGLFLLPYGSGTQYDVIIPTGRYIDADGEYHFSGILDTSHCGTYFNHIFWMTPYEFTVEKEVFDKSFTKTKLSVSYQCNNGRIENFKWW
jgi:hypothetical protein